MPLAIPTNITQTGNGQNLYLLEADSGGGGGAGVVQLVAGTNVTLSPPTGEGIVTINATSTPAPVTKLVAGSNITLSPSTGLGEVTISASGGGGGAVSSVSGTGAGINVAPTTGAVVVSNTGVTSIVAGDNVTVSGATGAVTVNASLSLNSGFPAINITAFVQGDNAISLTGSTTLANAFEIPLATAELGLFRVIYEYTQSITTSNGFTRTNSAYFKIAKSGIYTSLPPLFLGGFPDGNSQGGSAVGWATVFTEIFFDPNYWIYVISGKAMASQPRESNGANYVSVRLVRCAIGN